MSAIAMITVAVIIVIAIIIAMPIEPVTERVVTPVPIQIHIRFVVPTRMRNRRCAPDAGVVPVAIFVLDAYVNDVWSIPKLLPTIILGMCWRAHRQKRKSNDGRECGRE